jgi:hypothetical protein
VVAVGEEVARGIREQRGCGGLRVCAQREERRGEWEMGLGMGERPREGCVRGQKGEG